MLFLLSCGKPIAESQTNVPPLDPPETITLVVDTENRRDESYVTHTGFYHIPYIFYGQGKKSWAQVTFPGNLRLCLYSESSRWYSHHFRTRGNCQDDSHWEFRDSVKLEKGSPIILELIDDHKGRLEFYIQED